MTAPMTDADLLRLRLDLETAHREQKSTGATPTGEGLWRMIPALLATLGEARSRVDELRAKLEEAQEELELLDEVRAVVS